MAAFRAAHALDLPREALAEGTYAWVSGPTYETRGEAKLLAGAGACVVGMSTVPEVVAARDEGMRVLVLSLVTNMVVGVVSGTGVRSVRDELDDEVRYFNRRGRIAILILIFRWRDWRWRGHPRQLCRMRRFWRLGNRRRRS
jgi:hypothetical protein